MGHRVDHTKAVANRKIDAPENFQWYAWELLDDGSCLLEGCTSSGTYKSGKKKDRPIYDGTVRKVVVTRAEEQVERARYERETGKCSECGGDGQEWAGWNHETGHRFRPCSGCNATGKAAA